MPCVMKVPTYIMKIAFEINTDKDVINNNV